MPKSYIKYVGNGSNKQFDLTFSYISKAHIQVLFDGVSEDFAWVNDTRIQTTATPADGVEVIVKRVTPSSPLTTYPAASTLRGTDLTRALLQPLYLNEENGDAVTDGNARALHAPSTDNPELSLEIPGSADRAAKAAGYDSQGVPVVSTKTLAEIEAGALTSPIGIVSTLDDLRSFPVSESYVGQVIYIRGYAAEQDGGEGLFYCTSTNPGADDDGINVHSSTSGFYFKRVFDGIINVLWYGGRTADIGSLVGKAIDYVLANNGGLVYAPGGYRYTWSSNVDRTVPGSFAGQLKFLFDAAEFDCTYTSGYALKITKTGPDPSYGYMNIHGRGGRWIGNATANGALWFIDNTNTCWDDAEGYGFTYIPGTGPDGTMGSVIRVTTDAIQSELNSFNRPRGYNGAALMVFDRTAAAVTNGKTSILRQSVREPFWATGSGPANGTWFYFGPGVDVGDSEFSAIKGNWTCNSIVYVDTGVSLRGARFDGIDVEANSTGVGGNCKGLVLLKDHPSSSSLPVRPVICNVSPRVLAAGSGSVLPVWINASLASVQVEWKLQQPFNAWGLQIAGPIVRSGQYTNTNGVGDSGPVAARSGAAKVTLTPGGSAVVIPIPGVEGDESNNGIFAGSVSVRAWGTNGNAALNASATRSASSTAATITDHGSTNDTAGRTLSLDWTGAYLSIKLSGTGSDVSYMVDVSGVFQ